MLSDNELWEKCGKPGPIKPKDYLENKDNNDTAIALNIIIGGCVIIAIIIAGGL